MAFDEPAVALPAVYTHLGCCGDAAALCSARLLLKEAAKPTLVNSLVGVCADQTKAGRKGSAQGFGRDAELRGVYVVLDHCRILSTRDVFDKAAQAKVIAAKVKLPLDARVEGHVNGEGIRVWFADDDLVRVDGGVGKAGSVIQGVDQIPLFEECGEPSPGKKPVGNVPRLRARLLGTQFAYCW